MGFFRKSAAAAANAPGSPSARSSSGQGPSPQAPTPPAPGMQRIGVKVPPGMRPGMEIQFPTPQGPRFKAVIPPGVLEGSVFLVEVPIPGVPTAPTPAFRPPQPQPTRPPPQSSSGSFYPPFNPAPGGAGAYSGAAAVPPDSHRLARAPSNQMEEDAELQRSMARVPRAHLAALLPWAEELGSCASPQGAPGSSAPRGRAALLPWGEAGPLVLIAAAAAGVLELAASKVDATALWPMQAAGARGVAQPAGDAARGRRARARARRVVALRRLGEWHAAPPAPLLHCTLHLAPLHPAPCRPPPLPPPRPAPAGEREERERAQAERYSVLSRRRAILSEEAQRSAAPAPAPPPPTGTSPLYPSVYPGAYPGANLSGGGGGGGGSASPAPPPVAVAVAAALVMEPDESLPMASLMGGGGGSPLSVAPLGAPRRVGTPASPGLARLALGGPPDALEPTGRLRRGRPRPQSRIPEAFLPHRRRRAAARGVLHLLRRPVREAVRGAQVRRRPRLLPLLPRALRAPAALAALPDVPCRVHRAGAAAAALGGCRGLVPLRRAGSRRAREEPGAPPAPPAPEHGPDPNPRP